MHAEKYGKNGKFEKNGLFLGIIGNPVSGAKPMSPTAVKEM
jgi:hypothetical protein